MGNHLAPREFSARTSFLNKLRSVLRAPGIEPVLLKFVSGASAEARVAKLLPNHYQYPKPSLRSVNRNGIQFSLDISDLIDWAVYFNLYEKSQETLFQMVKPGNIVIDVGANIGSTALRFAQKVGQSGKVYGFEPDPANFAKCQKNISLNSFGNILLEPLALGAEEANLTLFRVSPRNPGMNKIMDQPPDESAVKVRSVKLDTYLGESGIKRVDLIKIDVEGFELRVLEGAKDTIQMYHPALFVEVSDSPLRAGGASASELIRKLHSWGYAMVRADNGQEVLPEQDFHGCHFDVVCTA